MNSNENSPPIVYTIAGSDSGGGAGIQADLHTIQNMNCHGCSAITCLTAQNSLEVTAVHAPPASFLTEQLDALYDDMPPNAVKVGMLGSVDLARAVGSFLAKITKEITGVKIVVDPVMISTSGHRLIDEETQKVMMECVFPYAHVLTPNKYEAEALLGRKLASVSDIEQAARDILQMGVHSVLIKGGHSLLENSSLEGAISPDVNATLGYAQDYFLSNSMDDTHEGRLCDGKRGVWLRTQRYDSDHTHGTGCTLSSSIASALAIGQKLRDSTDDSTGTATGAARAIHAMDACCLGKAYVTQGIGCGVQIGKGPGPVAQTHFPSSSRHFPLIALKPGVASTPPFLRMKSATSTSAVVEEDDDVPVLGTILPIVDSVEWVEKLCKIKGITDLQLRIKGEASTDPEKVLDAVQKANALCVENGVRLWINDFWEAAVAAGCFGVHVGQEDLATCASQGGLEKIREKNMALGVSTHSYAELAAALGAKPSYISLGPVFGTTSKDVAFDPQGLATVAKWRDLIPESCPLVAIGGINNADLAREVRDAGSECVAVIGAVTKADDVQDAVDQLVHAMER